MSPKPCVNRRKLWLERTTTGGRSERRERPARRWPAATACDSANTVTPWPAVGRGAQSDSDSTTGGAAAVRAGCGTVGRVTGTRCQQSRTVDPRLAPRGGIEIGASAPPASVSEAEDQTRICPTGPPGPPTLGWTRACPPGLELEIGTSGPPRLRVSLAASVSDATDWNPSHWTY